MLQKLCKEKPFFWALPAFLWQLIFLYAPLCYIIFLSLVRFEPVGGGISFTLEHYGSLMTLGHAATLLRSLVLAFATGVTSVCLGYPIAYYLACKVKHYKNTLLFFLMLPFWTNFLVLIYAWFFALERYGVINSLLLKVLPISEPFHLLYNTLAVFFIMVYCYLPFAILPLYSILEQIDVRLFEASRDLGAHGLQTMLRVTLPLSWSGVTTAFFLVFVPAFGEFVIPLLVGGGKQFYIGSMITHYFLQSSDYGIGSAFVCVSGLLLMSVTFMCSRVLQRMLGRKVV